MKPVIYAYDDYRKYLRNLFVYLKETRPAFSFRFFSREAGFASPNFLKLVMDGQRNLSARSMPKFIKGLKLGKGEAEYFENLVYFTQADTSEEKNECYQKMAKHRRYREIRQLERDQFDYYSHWYYPAVRELVAFRRFREDPDWIARQLVPPITSQQAKRALGQLLKLRLLERDGKGNLRQVDRTITSGAEVKSLAVKNFHRTMFEKAAEALDEVPAKERDISGVMVGIPEHLWPELKEKVAQFRKELLATIERNENEADRLYQLSIQLFPLSRGKDQKK